MEGQYSVITADLIDVIVTSSVNSFGSQRRFAKNLNIAELKNKLELLTGASAGSMKLELYRKDDKFVCNLDNDNALVGSYAVDNGMRIHVIDVYKKAGEFEDVSKVEKFELTEEEYANRTDTVKAHLERNKVGKYNEEEMIKKELEKKVLEEMEEEAVRNMAVGNRCQVKVPGQPERLATIMYLGKVHFKPGLWVGVKYDEPLGKNDGSVEDKRYFECSPKYGGFVKPVHIAVGDFPEEDFGLEDEM